MHVHFLDPYQPRRSPVHQLDPRIKLVLALAFILTATLTSAGAWAAYILLFALVFSLAILSDLGAAYILKRSALALPFMLSALPVIFTTHGDVSTSLTIGNWNLIVYQPGLVRFTSIALKSWISVQAAILLTVSTPFPDLLMAMRSLGVPRLIVGVIGLMWRYLFVLADEALRLIRARSARSGDAGDPGLRRGGSPAWRARVAGGMAGNLFLRAFERSDRIYMAMLSRGYDGEVRLLPRPRISPLHWVILGIGLGILAVLLALSFML